MSVSRPNWLSADKILKNGEKAVREAENLLKKRPPSGPKPLPAPEVPKLKP